MTEDSKKEKILIVDDNKENIVLLMNLFKDKDKIVPAIKPRRALEIDNSENPPDLILLDIPMPEMDGYEVCNMLKNNEKTKKIPIIFVTAVSDGSDGCDQGVCARCCGLHYNTISSSHGKSPCGNAAEPEKETGTA